MKIPKYIMNTRNIAKCKLAPSQSFAPEANITSEITENTNDTNNITYRSVFVAY